MALSDPCDSKTETGKKPYKTYDCDGLFLLVNPSGSKLWRWRYRLALPTESAQTACAAILYVRKGQAALESFLLCFAGSIPLGQRGTE